jgi:quinol monooxygenase YgiN
MKNTASRDRIYTWARFVPHPGKLDEFKRLAQQAVAIVRAQEPGTLLYEWWFNDDESECLAVADRTTEI